MLPGAVYSDGSAKAASPLHFGAPVAEQRAFLRGRALAPLEDWQVLALTGEDRLRLLHALTSQSFERLPVGEGREALILSPQGRVEHAFFAADVTLPAAPGSGEPATLLLTEPGAAAALAEFLTRMRFTMRVEVAEVSGELAVFAAWRGSAAAELLAALAPVVAWRDAWPEVQPGGAGYADDFHAEGTEWCVDYVAVRREALPQLATAAADAGITGAGSLALTALEVHAARPRLCMVDKLTLPHELDWLRTAVHLSKGCYRGQETVAKVHNLGHPPRRLTLLHINGELGSLPAAGTPVTLASEGVGAGEKQVGQVLRAGYHADYGAIALALLRRSVPVDASLALPGTPATQQLIVPPSAGGLSRPTLKARPHLNPGRPLL